MSNTPKVKNFEKNLQELESLVDALESGELNLEDSLTQFEKGIKMTKACQDALNTAEQRVHVLLEKEGSVIAEDFPKHEV